MLSKGWIWFKQTSTLVGIPVTFLLLIVMAQKFTFTATCEVAGYFCELGISRETAVYDYVDSLLREPLDEPPVLNKRK